MSRTPLKCTSSPSETPKRDYVCYVVWEGKKPGIYFSWPECKEQVSGFKKNCYKGYYSYEEAQAAFQGEQLHDEASECSSEMCPNCERLMVRIKILEAQVAYLSEKNATPSPSKGKSVSDHLGELSDMLKKKAVLDDS